MSGDRERLKAHFDTPLSNQGDKWSQLWDTGDFLPFDRGAPNPALNDTLCDRKDIIGQPIITSSGKERRQKALVPGCGKGYDVLLLASFGYDAFGLEISATAVRRCREEEQKNGDKYPTMDERVGRGQVKFVQGDFFKDDWVTSLRLDEERFNLIYDYTFLCALPPSMRPAWALRHSQLLASGVGSNLICLEFPSYKDPSNGGPPYGLQAQVYMEHLSHPGEQIPYHGNGFIQENPSRRASSNGLERVARWQPERTHEIGKGTDWISIWRHR
ncbi:hypothetical protein MMC09_004289 [Bachmanniomyces sp. S44760]|nr:hypothetical protein [Bachmanniomyces sp. S44760]